MLEIIGFIVLLLIGLVFTIQSVLGGIVLAGMSGRWLSALAVVSIPLAIGIGCLYYAWINCPIKITFVA